MREVLFVISLCFFSWTFAQEDAYNLGDLGAEGLPLEKIEFEKFNLQKEMHGIRITALDPEGPAQKAGLSVGMVIIGAGKAMFTKKSNPLHLLLLAMEATTAKKAPEPLTLIVTDGTKPQKIKVELSFSGGHSATCPKKCDRCSLLIKTGLDFLQSQQDGNGGIPSKMMNMQSRIVITSLTGLAFLGTGSTYDSGDYAEPIQKCVTFIEANIFSTNRIPGLNPTGEGSQVLQASSSMGRDNWNQENWALSYAPIFLCELYKRSPRPEILALLKQIGVKLLQNQETSGGWGHGPGGPNALGYVELEVMSNWALASLGMMKSVGVSLEDEKINKAVQYVVECGTADGGMAYSKRPGQSGYGEVGRTGGATFGFQMLKLFRHPYYGPLTKYLKRNMEKTASGHVSPVMHYLAVGIACANVSPAYWKEFYELFRNEFMLCRGSDGSFHAVPTEETQQLKNNCDRGLGPNWATASYLILLQIPLGNYKVLTPK
ncbi:MAG: DUF6288 domain-containing protein [Planctomycetota bacterium]